jgi:hypothetical protein
LQSPQLVTDERKVEHRKSFFRKLFEQTEVYLVTQQEPPRIRKERLESTFFEKIGYFYAKNNKAQLSS